MSCLSVGAGRGDGTGGDGPDCGGRDAARRGGGRGAATGRGAGPAGSDGSGMDAVAAPGGRQRSLALVDRDSLP